MSNTDLRDELTPYLKQLITESSLPLKAVETCFAADSSGFATGQFSRWFDSKYGEPKQQHDWVKVHIMCGVKTNVVTSVEVWGRTPTTARTSRRCWTRPRGAAFG